MRNEREMVGHKVGGTRGARFDGEESACETVDRKKQEKQNQECIPIAWFKLCAFRVYAWWKHVQDKMGVKRKGGI